MSLFELSPAVESPDVAGLRRRYRLLVDGKLVDGAGESRPLLNPATGEPLCEVDAAGPAEVDAAVKAARRAHDRVWSKLPGAERAKVLFRISRLVAERARELAAVQSLERGVPIRASRDVDAAQAAALLFHYAGWADKLGHAGYGPDPRPLGVIGQVLGGGSPLLAAARRLAPALACGNTVVLKPGAAAPLSALVLADICRQGELPPGVLNVLPGGADTGAALVGHGGVDGVGFSGSAAVGKQVQAALAGTGRRLRLELGGGGTTVVFDDAPLDQALDGVAEGAIACHGQLAAAGSRLLVQESIAEVFLAGLRERVAALRVGDPMDRNTDVGPVGSRAALDRLAEFVAAGEDEGAQRWTAPDPVPQRGFFFAPTILDAVAPTMRVARGQPAGPVLAVLSFRTPQEAVALADAAAFGRAATIWTEKGSRALWVAGRVRAGVVWSNTAPRFDPAAPLGGHREAGLGRDGGRAGLEAYLHV